MIWSQIFNYCTCFAFWNREREFLKLQRDRGNLCVNDFKLVEASLGWQDVFNRRNVKLKGHDQTAAQFSWILAVSSMAIEVPVASSFQISSTSTIYTLNALQNQCYGNMTTSFCHLISHSSHPWLQASLRFHKLLWIVMDLLQVIDAMFSNTQL